MSIPWRRCVMNDLKFAFRQLLKNPGFAAVAVLTLALGIGANTAIYSVVDGVLLRPLPFADPERVLMVWQNDTHHGAPREWVSPANFLDWAKETRTFSML